MCMKNVNATVNVEAINSQDEIITKKVNNVKQILIDDATKKARVFISFYSTIINGAMGFFDKNKKLSWQLRITDKTGSLKNTIVLNEFETELSVKSENYFKSDFIDFINDNRSCKTEVKISNIDDSEIYFLTILVKGKEARENNDGWTVQSAIPLRFTYVGQDSIKRDKSATD